MEIDDEGKAMDELEKQIKTLEWAISRVETGLSSKSAHFRFNLITLAIQARLKQGQALFDGVALTPRSTFYQVDWWFGVLTVQVHKLLVYHF